jgi:hypothetical protein
MREGQVFGMLDTAVGTDWSIEGKRYLQMTPAEARSYAKQRNKEAEQRRDADDRLERTKPGDPLYYTKEARDARRWANSRELSQRRNDTTNSARRDCLQRTVQGDRMWLDHLRYDADWFWDSTSYQRRDPNRPAASDAEIVECARRMLPSYGGSSAPAPASPKGPALKSSTKDIQESWKRAHVQARSVDDGRLKSCRPEAGASL